MSRLFVVRHGQASLGSEDYDNLSPIGESQCQALGDYWLKLGYRFSPVYAGPKRRHQQTADLTGKVFQDAGEPWPTLQPLADFDEHQGAPLVHKVLRERGRTDLARPRGKEAIREYFRHFQAITLQWVKGEVHTPELESWQAFRERVIRAFSQLTANADSGTELVLFTSGGPMSLIAGHLLGLDDERVMQQSWVMRNIAFLEILFSKDQATLISMNCLPHITNTDWITLI